MVCFSVGMVRKRYVGSLACWSIFAIMSLMKLFKCARKRPTFCGDEFDISNLGML